MVMSQTKRQHLKPNHDVLKLMPTFQNQPQNLEMNANILNQAPMLPNQQ